MIHFSVMIVQRDLLMASFLSLISRSMASAIVDSVVQVMIILSYLGRFLYLLILQIIRDGKIEKIKARNLKKRSKLIFPALEFGIDKITVHLNMVGSRTHKVHAYLIYVHLLNLAVPTMIVIGAQTPFYILVCCSALHALVALYVLFSVPNKSKRLNSADFTTYILSAVVYGLVSYLSMMKDSSEDDSKTEKEYYTYIGNRIVLACAANCVLALINGLASVIESVYFFKNGGKTFYRNIERVNKEVEMFGEEMNEGLNLNDRKLLRVNEEGSNVNNSPGKNTRVPNRSTQKFMISSNLGHVGLQLKEGNGTGDQVFESVSDGVKTRDKKKTEIRGQGLRRVSFIFYYFLGFFVKKSLNYVSDDGGSLRWYTVYEKI